MLKINNILLVGQISRVRFVKIKLTQRKLQKTLYSETSGRQEDSCPNAEHQRQSYRGARGACAHHTYTHIHI